MFAANNKMVVIDSAFDHDTGAGFISYGFEDFVTKFGLVIPMGQRAWNIFDMIRKAETPEQLSDLAHVKQFLSPGWNLPFFHMDWSGDCYMCRFINDDDHAVGSLVKFLMPKGDHFTAVTRLNSDEASALNALLKSVKTVPELQEILDQCTSRRVLAPIVLLKEEFVKSKPEGASNLPNFFIKWE